MAMDISVPEVDKKNDLDYWPRVWEKMSNKASQTLSVFPQQDNRFDFPVGSVQMTRHKNNEERKPQINNRTRKQTSRQGVGTQ